MQWHCQHHWGPGQTKASQAELWTYSVTCGCVMQFCTHQNQATVGLGVLLQHLVLVFAAVEMCARAVAACVAQGKASQTQHLYLCVITRVYESLLCVCMYMNLFVTGFDKAMVNMIIFFLLPMYYRCCC